jgi:magnesium-transporting ATPase (P-type)
VGAEELLGDPLDIATMQASGFVFATGGDEGVEQGAQGAVALYHEGRGLRLRVRHKYPFTSELKRMSVLVECAGDTGAGTGAGKGGGGGAGKGEGGGGNGGGKGTDAPAPPLYLFTKGAPEVLARYLAFKPAYYDSTYFYHMSRGRRVLALAYRSLSEVMLYVCVCVAVCCLCLCL